MVLKGDLDALVDYKPAAGSPVLSVYLDVDQSNSANLNRGFEVSLRNALRGVEQQLGDEKGRLSAFQEDADRVWEFISAYSPAGKGLVAMCDVSAKYFWHRNLQVRMPNEAHWLAKPYIRPLVEARDEFARYGVILTDRRQARLFIVFLNEVEETRETLARFRVKQFKSAGMDRIWSQMVFQRKADVHAKWHLKKVVEMMARLEEEQEFDRLVVGGPTEVVSILETLLTDRLRSRLIGLASLPVEASEKDILEETNRLEQEHQRKSEKELVDLLLTAAGKERRAVTGLRGTVRAAVEGRVMSLVYEEGRQARGAECVRCGTLFEGQPQSCPQCGGYVQPVDDLMERLVESAVKTGESVELVRGEAAETLEREGGGIGAFLRF